MALPAKRKRAQVSYVEADVEAINASDVESIEDDVSDGIYGSRKKPLKKKAKQTKKAKPMSTKPFPFMSLPPELRDYIYELALVQPQGLALVSKTKAYRRTIARGVIYGENGARTHGFGPRRTVNDDGDNAMPSGLNSLSPNLLAVSKAIRSEAIGYLYKQPIILEDTKALHTFIAAIGSSGREQIFDITVSSWGSGRGAHKSANCAALNMLSTCPNLKRLLFDCHIGCMRQPKRLAQQIYRDGHFFFEAFGSANGRKDAAVDILELSEWNYERDNYYSWRGTGNNLPDPENCKSQFQAELRKLLGCSMIDS